jgi:hypothetical protein
VLRDANVEVLLALQGPEQTDRSTLCKQMLCPGLGDPEVEAFLALQEAKQVKWSIIES